MENSNLPSPEGDQFPEPRSGIWKKIADHDPETMEALHAGTHRMVRTVRNC
jgi:hypothetical protein